MKKSVLGAIFASLVLVLSACGPIDNIRLSGNQLVGDFSDAYPDYLDEFDEPNPLFQAILDAIDEDCPEEDPPPVDPCDLNPGDEGYEACDPPCEGDECFDFEPCEGDECFEPCEGEDCSPCFDFGDLGDCEEYTGGIWVFFSEDLSKANRTLCKADLATLSYVGQSIVPGASETVSLTLDPDLGDGGRADFCGLYVAGFSVFGEGDPGLGAFQDIDSSPIFEGPGIDMNVLVAINLMASQQFFGPIPCDQGSKKAKKVVAEEVPLGPSLAATGPGNAQVGTIVGALVLLIGSALVLLRRRESAGH